MLKSSLIPKLMTEFILWNLACGALCFAAIPNKSSDVFLRDLMAWNLQIEKIGRMFKKD